MTNKKIKTEVTTFDVQVAEFIRNHKNKVQLQTMKSMTNWLFHLRLMLTESMICSNVFRTQDFDCR